MKELFDNIVTKGSKIFTFKVEQLDDGTFRVSQITQNKLVNGRIMDVFEKVLNYKTLEELKEGGYKNTRQGKLFLDSEFWIGK